MYHALYVRTNDYGDLLILCLYVDYVIFWGSNLKMIGRWLQAYHDGGIWDD